MSDNIKVVVKVRPLISREVEEKLSYRWRVKSNSLYQLDLNGRETDTIFTFDKVYDKDTKTLEVFNDVAKPIVEAAIAGINGTIFAYGQTSSGKTYTMSGTENSPGIIPLAVLNLFEKIKNIPDRDFLVRVSYIEIYNEMLKDLLNVERKNIKVQETLQGVKVDSTERVTSSPDEILDAMKEGEANRQTGATNMNEESSRSHSIFQITIESREHVEGEEEVGCVNVSQLNLVDLAGSERSGQTGATGIRFKEGTHINKSLSSLALVIKQLSEDPNKFANYRDSKLTRILQNSLGGNAKTSIICAVTPASVEETISTLKFANRAKAIKNKPEVNAVATDATMIQSLTKQLARLQAELISKRNLEVMLESKKNVEVELQKQIAGLQKLILNGFEQRVAGARRPPPRRVTISTLHHERRQRDQHEPAPRFCTPGLKYNPMMLSAEFLPIHNQNKLPSVPEETRMITPPPPEKKVNLEDEIIELDSDDDDESEKACSPYHSCYKNSKTPPCILRKNAKQAEKNLKDIVELTEREKIYTPSVVELIERLEGNTTLISQLQEDINTLAEKSKEKDNKIKELTDKIDATKEEVKTMVSDKAKLEANCKSLNAQITDWEVSYETLMKKAKTREQELLKLLEERSGGRKTADIGKLSENIENKIIDFMDTSKDISLVKSDSESSGAHTNDNDVDSTAETHFQGFVANMKTELESKNQVILELESNLTSHQKKIESLENSSQQLLKTIEDYKSRMSLIETENWFLKSTVESLNTTVQNQKKHLESAGKDIQSFNAMIHELQMKLENKDKILNSEINDSTLETMIANEDKFLANNDNIKNIILSLKIALDSKNKEISNLNSTAQLNTELTADNQTLREEAEINKKLIGTLIEEAEKLKDQLNENVEVISKLMKVETNLTSQLNLIQNQNDELNKNNLVNEAIIKSLKSENLKKNEELSKHIDDMTQKIEELEKELKEKNNSKSIKDQESQFFLAYAETIIRKLYAILLLINNSIENNPEKITCLNVAFKTVDDKLDSLNKSVENIIEEKNFAIQTKKKLEDNLATIVDIHKSEIEKLHEQIGKIKNDMIVQTEALSLQVTQLTNELDRINAELDNKNKDNIELEIKLNDAKENNENLRNDLVSKENNISSLLENLATLNKEIESLEKDKNNKVSLENLLSEKDLQLISMGEKLSSVTKSVEEKYKEITTALKDAIENRDKLLMAVLNKAFKLTQEHDIENNMPSENCTDNIYQHIMVTLDKIETHMTYLTARSTKQNDIEKMLLLAKQQMEDLTEENLKFINEYTEVSDNNQKLLAEMQKINKLNKELLGASELMNQLNAELEIKSNEIKSLENKALKWKDKFHSYEYDTKQHLEKLILENNYLRLQVETRRQSVQTPSCPNLSPLKSVLTSTSTFDNHTPQSLFTISFNKILDAIQPNDLESHSVTPSSSKTSVQIKHVEIQTEECYCDKLSLQLEKSREENLKLIDQLSTISDENIRLVNLLNVSETSNQFLLHEREEVRKEIQLLMEPAHELQKKIANHRTNLSTLTATTYTENSLLNSQLKVLKHHHTRYIQVCQRDLPSFKTQLAELLALLKDNSLADKHNNSFKRYSLPDVLDSSSSGTLFKNESILDGDLLMLDTNVTMTTVDNTLVGPDQTCLDATQVNFDNDEHCQANDINKTIDPNLIYSQMESITRDNQKLNEQLEISKHENNILKEKIRSVMTKSSSYKDAQISPIKLNGSSESVSKVTCQTCEEFRTSTARLTEKIEMLTEKINHIEVQKSVIEQKYSNLALEMPSTEILVKKLTETEKEHQKATQEIIKLMNDISKRNKIITELQQENDTLSVQVMDNISEVDDLKKELDDLKDTNSRLAEKCDYLELTSKPTSTDVKNAITCRQCELKDERINNLQVKQMEQSKLNRSLSDSDSCSRYNKICTLQNELHASKEDCKKITAEVATIKDHLERSNISVDQAMDLDESMGDSNIFTLVKDFDTVESNKAKVQRLTDVYTLDKIDCFKFYVEKTGADKENLDCNIKIIDVMEKFYNYFVSNHGREIENLMNNLKDFEKSKSHLETQLSDARSEYNKMKKELEESNNNTIAVSNVLSKIRVNINIVKQEIPHVIDSDKSAKFVTLFKENLLKVLDSEFNLSCVNIFESLIEDVFNKHQVELSAVMEQYTKLQSHTEKVGAELNSVNENLKQLKSQLTDKELEYNLLKAQKEKVHEISNAVTLDLVKKEKDLTETIVRGCKKLVELNIMAPYEMDSSLSVNGNIKLLFERLIAKDESRTEKEINILKQQVTELKNTVEENEKIIESLKNNLKLTEDDLKSQHSLNETLNKVYENKIEENKANLKTIEKLKDDINLLKKVAQQKESVAKLIEKIEIPDIQDVKNVTDLLAKMKSLQQDFNNLKSVNEMITKERDTYAIELEKAKEVISRNKIELEKMTSDILILRESVNDNVSVIESLTMEAKSLMEQNLLLKKQFDEKNQVCGRLELNIKTHEKTAEIQSKMIIRLQKQKEEDDIASSEKEKRLNELSEQVVTLQVECETLSENLKMAKEEVELMKNKKESLESRVSELEAGLEAGRRRSGDSSGEHARRRRQTVHDAMRAIDHELYCDDHNNIEEVFDTRGKPDDLFMDVDDDSDNRSTPIRLSKGRDSFTSRQDQSDKESSRPSSVALTRRRRQSIHDLHRSVIRNTPSPHGRPSIRDVNIVKSDSTGLGESSEGSALESQLSECRQQLEELRARYRELDEECDTCAQYLRERDDTCRALRRERAALQLQVAELNEKIKNSQIVSQEDCKRSIADASVNTDEDWANLHAVVVDRMSFDAEVEKNKKLSRTIEELRCNKQELKNTISKMQRALDKNAAYRDSKELEATKQELATCRQELAELQERYRELDEECDTCAQYLRERDDTCRKLREAKLALEAKLEDLQADANNMVHSVRRKRQSIHDQNRGSPTHLTDAGTETSDVDFLSYQVERDDNSSKLSTSTLQELKQVKNALDKVLREKAALENQLVSGTPTMYVATGSAIIQNQQLTDVMKENQKLKKMNAKLINICKKRNKSQECDRENDSREVN